MTKKYLFFGLIFAFLALIALKRDYFLNALPEGLKNRLSSSSSDLSIVLNTDATDLSPYRLDLNNRLRTANLYEGLVTFDKNLTVMPGLALRWGNLEPTTWEFKLRGGVLFHDGASFAAQDVVDSFERARKEGGAEIAGILKTIKAIHVIDPRLIRIETEAPDPLLLNKLTSFYITHPGDVGTGPYEMSEWVKGKAIRLKIFPQYWGEAPRYKNLEYGVIPDPWQRSQDFKNGTIDILVDVPKEEALKLGNKVKQSYSLEVNFLMFNLKNPLWQDRTLREKVRALIDPAQIEAIGNGFVRPVSQFIAPGVFGYNPEITPPPFEASKKATDLFDGKRKKVTFDYVETYETLAQYLHQELRSAGFAVEMNPLPAATLLERIRSNQSQLFLLGWQAENGDTGGFLDAFIHSSGEFNNGRYRNPDIDALIEQSRTETDPQKRLKMLQEILKKVDQELIGIPLFESSRLYALKSGIQWDPRLDGLVLGREVK